MSNQDDYDPLADAQFDTLAVRTGIHRTHEGEHSEPIFTTSSYVFTSAAEAAAAQGKFEEAEKRYSVRVNSRPAVAAVVFKEGEANTVEVSRQINAVFDKLKEMESDWVGPE